MSRAGADWPPSGIVSLPLIIWSWPRPQSLKFCDPPTLSSLTNCSSLSSRLFSLLRFGFLRLFCHRSVAIIFLVCWHINGIFWISRLANFLILKKRKCLFCYFMASWVGKERKCMVIGNVWSPSSHPPSELIMFLPYWLSPSCLFYTL